MFLSMFSAIVYLPVCQPSDTGRRIAAFKDRPFWSSELVRNIWRSGNADPDKQGNADNVGMGPQCMSRMSARNCAHGLLRHFGAGNFRSGCINMLIVGCGYGEEWLAMAKSFAERKILFHFYCIDFHVCCNDLSRSVIDLKLEDFISVKQFDGYMIPIEFIRAKNINIIYTTAELEEIFYLKLLYLSVSCNSVELLVLSDRIFSVVSKAKIVHENGIVATKDSSFARCFLDNGEENPIEDAPVDERSLRSLILFCALFSWFSTLGISHIKC